MHSFVLQDFNFGKPVDKTHTHIYTQTPHTLSHMQACTCAHTQCPFTLTPERAHAGRILHSAIWPATVVRKRRRKKMG